MAPVARKDSVRVRVDKACGSNGGELAPDGVHTRILTLTVSHTVAHTRTHTHTYVHTKNTLHYCCQRGRTGNYCTTTAVNFTLNDTTISLYGGNARCDLRVRPHRDDVPVCAN
jgi:hypothetical protein